MKDKYRCVTKFYTRKTYVHPSKHEQAEKESRGNFQFITDQSETYRMNVPLIIISCQLQKSSSLFLVFHVHQKLTRGQKKCVGTNR